MTEDWIRTVLAQHVQGDMVVLKTLDDGTVYAVSTNALASMFGGIPANYASLRDADAKAGYGYTQYFDQWHAEGLI